MAVTLETTIKRWIGLSSDTKPIPGQTLFDPAHNISTLLGTADVPAGSSFMESDTGFIYRWSGELWTRAPSEQSDELYVLQAILIQLTELRQTVALIIGE